MYSILDPFIDYYYNMYPQAGYMRFANARSNRGYAFQNWLRNQYGRLYNTYASILPENPNLTWMGFLSRQSPEREYGSLGYRERGEYPARFSPRTRFVGF